MRSHRRSTNALAALRERMIAETELGLLIGLKFPQRLPRIPTVEAGTGTFSREFAAGFWSEALGLDIEELAAIEAAYDHERLAM